MIREENGNLLFDFFAVAFKSAKVLVNAVMNVPPLALPLLEAGKARDSFDLDPAISVYCELVQAPAKQPHVHKQQQEAFQHQLFYPRLFVEIQGSGFLVWPDCKFRKALSVSWKIVSLAPLGCLIFKSCTFSVASASSIPLSEITSTMLVQISKAASRSL